MAAAAAAVIPAARREQRRSWIETHWAEVGLVLVGFLFLAVQLLLVPRPFGFTTDEATYLAMVDPSVPELYWTPPRAWGISVLAAPVAAFSAGLQVTRIYFSGLAGLGLVAAFWPWLRVLHRAVAPLAALLFSTMWFTVYFGPQVMPNLYVALLAVAAVGIALRSACEPAWWRSALAAAAGGLVALLRPTDSVLVFSPLFLCAFLVPRLRRIRMLGALAVGVLLGWLPWVVEAYSRFGGPVARLAAAENAGPKGLSVDLSRLSIVPRLLDGAPAYCCLEAPATNAGPIPVIFTVWLLVCAVIAALGVVAAARRGQLPEVLLVSLPAGLLAAFYTLLPSFTTLRFLLPVFALLSMPVAMALVSGLTASHGARRKAMAALLAAGIVAHVGLMLPTADRVLEQHARTRMKALQLSDALRPLVDGRPCLLAGVAPRATAYYLGCAVHAGRPKRYTPRRVQEAQSAGHIVLWVLHRPPPADTTIGSWQKVTIPGMPPGWQVYLPPSWMLTRPSR